MATTGGEGFCCQRDGVVAAAWPRAPFAPSARSMSTACGGIRATRARRGEAAPPRRPSRTETGKSDQFEGPGRRRPSPILKFGCDHRNGCSAAARGRTSLGVTQPISSPALLGSGDRSVQLRMHDYALLSSGFIAGADKHRRRGTAVDCNMRDARWNEDVIARMRRLAVLQSITGPQLHLLAAQKVERRLVPLMHVRLRALTGCKAHHSEPQRT